MATFNADSPKPSGGAGGPERITVAGMAADLYGVADERPPLVLLHGLTFDRRIWRPVLDHLARVDPDRRVLALDLPGHGESPGQLPHSPRHILELIRQAVDEAGLTAPVLVGHSISGGFASFYAARHPTRGVVNIDAAPDPAVLAQLRSVEAQARGAGFYDVWAMMEASFRTDLLPAAARELVAGNSRPRQDLVVSYWDGYLRQTPAEAEAMLTNAMAEVARSEVPYLLILGAEWDPDKTSWLSDALPQLKVEVWPDTGHFPHLAHPGRFARVLATAEVPVPDDTRAGDPGVDAVIDAHFDAEDRADLDALMATVTDDITHEVFGAELGALHGKDAVRGYYALLSRELSLDDYITINRAHGPGFVWEEGVIHATAKGQPFGFEGHGRRISYRINHLFEIRDGLISRELAMPDIAVIIAQLSRPLRQDGAAK